MPKSGQERKLRRKARKRAEDAKAMSKKRESPDSSGDRLIETHDDLRLFSRLQKRRDWKIPDDVYKQVPNNLARLATDLDRKDSTQIAASRELRMMARDNVTRDQQEIRVTFNPSVAGVLRPEPPRRADEDQAEGNARPIAFIEQPSAEDALETLRILQELGIEHQIVDQPSEHALHHLQGNDDGLTE